jgi:RNA ligase
MTRVKYPRSFHLPWSPGATSDDKVLSSVEHFAGQEVVVTAKMDGENTTMYRDGIHARSLDGAHHESQAWVRALQGRIGRDIPEGWRVCGENLFAKHSISYTGLPSYFQVFSIWNEKNEALSWDETTEWAALLDLVTVPVLWRGTWDEATIKGLYQPKLGGNDMEGYVVRVAASFPYAAFAKSLAKFVRPNHVQTDQHWKASAVVANKLL